MIKITSFEVDTSTGNFVIGADGKPIYSHCGEVELITAINHLVNYIAFNYKTKAKIFETRAEVYTQVKSDSSTLTCFTYSGPTEELAHIMGICSVCED